MFILRSVKASSNEKRGGRFFAAIWEKIGRGNEKIRQDIAGGAKGRVLEIGSGTGFNLRYYGAEVEGVVASEPNAHMLRRAESRVDEASVPVELRQVSADELPFEDGSPHPGANSHNNRCRI